MAREANLALPHPSPMIVKRAAGLIKSQSAHIQSTDGDAMVDDACIDPEVDDDAEHECAK
jgi:hypothetical protein